MQPEHKEILQAIIVGKTIQKLSLFSNEWYDIPKDEVVEVLSFASADILRVKPSTININGFEVPEPVHQELEPGQTYYYISFEFDIGKAYSKDIWADYSNDKQRLLAGIIHLTEEAVIQHSNALLSFTQKPKP